jgi:Family of unknown function (DUF5947)
MSIEQSPASASPIARLQRFARPSQPQKRCELCGAAIAPEHPHLLELKTRQLSCACGACAILFSSDNAGTHRRVPDRVSLLPNLNISDEIWDALHVPINLAFFYRSGAAKRIIAMYPSPAGAMESLLSIDAWDDLAAQNSALQQMQSDVEALLVNRILQKRDALLVPIDACYKLVGIIRTTWRGLSGGKEVWQQIDEFFADLYRKGGGNRSQANA